MKARSHRRALFAAITLLLLHVPATAAAAPKQVLEDKEARAHFKRAQEHFASEDYAAAIPELKAAYGLEPNPMLLYAWAQAERLAGNCARAVELYRRFLETDPDEEQRSLTEANLLDCEAELPDPDPAVDAVPEEPEDDEPLPPDEPLRPWYADPLGGVLVGLGVAGIAGGGVPMGLARRKVREAPNADVEDGHVALVAEAQRLNTAGIIVLSAGSALLAGGVIRYAVMARKGRKSDEAAARWAPVWTGTGVGLRGSF